MNSAALTTTGAAAAVLLSVQVLRVFPAWDMKYFSWFFFVQTHVSYWVTNLTSLWSRIFCGHVAWPTSSEEVTSSFISSLLQRGGLIKRGHVIEITNKGTLSGGWVGSMHRLTLKSDAEVPGSAVLKTISSTFSSRYSSLLLGSVREAKFYERYGSLSEYLHFPKIYGVKYSQFAGIFTVLMEDINPGASLSPLLGNQCWGPVERPPNAPSNEEIMNSVVDIASTLHSKFWVDEKLLSEGWLKAVNLIQGSDRARFELSLYQMKARWDIVLKRLAEDSSYSVDWNEKFRAGLANLMKNSTWERYQIEMKELKKRFTLCHGDFHGGNMLYRLGNVKEDESRYVLVDWAEVGVGDGATEIAQFCISNLTTEFRRKHERAFVQRYWDGLVKNGVNPEAYPFEECWRCYRRGGVERWLQMGLLMGYFGAAHNRIPNPACQWFIDQVTAFLEDHYDPNVEYCLWSVYCMEM